MSTARELSKLLNYEGNFTISGDLIIGGTTTTINAEEITMADNTILLNSNETGTPTQDAGIEVERGTSANKSLLWDETNDRWTIGTEVMVGQTFNALSDITLKENVKPIESALDKVTSLNGVSFNWKHSGDADIGFIAQEVEEVLPDLVKTNATDGIKSVSYQNIVAVLVEAMKEQQKMIEELQSKLGN